jgi:hypothetical protein
VLLESAVQPEFRRNREAAAIIGSAPAYRDLVEGIVKDGIMS